MPSVPLSGKKTSVKVYEAPHLSAAVIREPREHEGRSKLFLQALTRTDRGLACCLLVCSQCCSGGSSVDWVLNAGTFATELRRPVRTIRTERADC